MHSEEYLYERGMKAEALLRSDGFNDLFELVTSEVAKEILESPLHDNTYREQLYLTVNGMRAFALRLTSYAEQKKSIEDRANAENDQQEIDY